MTYKTNEKYSPIDIVTLLDSEMHSQNSYYMFINNSLTQPNTYSYIRI